MFQTDIPEIHGPGQIKRRTDNFFTPQSQFYDKISVECQRAGVSVDLFLLPSSYTDVFTLGQLCHFTGGQLHYHYNFSGMYLFIVTQYRGSRLIGRLGSRHSVPFIRFSRLTEYPDDTFNTKN